MIWYVNLYDDGSIGPAYPRPESAEFWAGKHRVARLRVRMK